jgi:hypothetical protein
MTNMTKPASPLQIKALAPLASGVPRILAASSLVYTGSCRSVWKAMPCWFSRNSTRSNTDGGMIEIT